MSKKKKDKTENIYEAQIKQVSLFDADSHIVQATANQQIEITQTPADVGAPSDTGVPSDTGAPADPATLTPHHITIPQHAEKPKKKSVKKVVWIAVAAFLAVAIAFGTLFYNQLMSNPESLFEGTNDRTQIQETVDEPDSIMPEPTTGVDPFLISDIDEHGNIKTLEQINSEIKNAAEEATIPEDPDTSFFTTVRADKTDEIFNVLLLGIDYAEERDNWDGKYTYHSDVMMVAAFNKTKQRIDLISIPRDTIGMVCNPKITKRFVQYTKSGYFRLNSAINVGAYYAGNESNWELGVPTTVRTMEWMLGGVKINGYIAVTMSALKDIVDALGGVYLDVEVAYQIKPRPVVQKGYQFLNGQQFLDYCRARKGMAQGGDQNRINRQKKALIALFNQLKNDKSKSGSVLIEMLTNMMRPNYFVTDLSLAQLSGLTVFAMQNVDVANIGTYSMGGTGATFFSLSAVFTNQSKRQKIIKQIYGIDVAQIKDYSQKTLTEENNKAILAMARAEANKVLTKYGPKMSEAQRQRIKNAINNGTAAEIIAACKSAGYPIKVANVSRRDPNIDMR